MKTNNWIVYGLCLVISVALLFVWYALGFNKIDQPLDLMVTLIWWALIIVAVILVIVFENKRKQRIRTIYVGKDFIYNSESGIKGFADQEQLAQVMGDTLSGLTYNFEKSEIAEDKQDQIEYVVYTDKYAANSWKGDVAMREAEAMPFHDKSQLMAILQTYMVKEQRTW